MGDYGGPGVKLQNSKTAKQQIWSESRLVFAGLLVCWFAGF
jgi:hypothetical protein